MFRSVTVAGCPLENMIPVERAHLFGLLERRSRCSQIHEQLPEFTGRICPAPCESACTVGIDGDDPVSIRHIERTLADNGYSEGYTVPRIPEKRTGKSIAIIGSGPAGLAAADQLNQMGHTVTVYERDQFCGGFLRYGIPDFKLDKEIVERRIDLMREEGITFETGVNVGKDISIDYLQKKFDSICVTIGARQARDLPVRVVKLIVFTSLWNSSLKATSV